MTKTLILAAAALAAAGCAEEPAPTEEPILDGPAEVVTEPTDDAVMDPVMTDDELMMGDSTIMEGGTMTEGETMTDDAM